MDDETLRKLEAWVARGKLAEAAIKLMAAEMRTPTGHGPVTMLELQRDGSVLVTKAEPANPSKPRFALGDELKTRDGSIGTVVRIQRDQDGWTYRLKVDGQDWAGEFIEDSLSRPAPKEAR